MATTQSKSPSFFNFLREGLLLPTHNRRLFAAVFAIIVASRYLLCNDLAAADEVRIDSKRLNGTTDDPSSREFIHLAQTRKLLFTGAVDRLVSTSIGSVTQIVILFAAVATYSGELLTFASLLGKAKTKLKGPLLTLAFVYVLDIAYMVLLFGMARLLAFLAFKQYGTLLFRGMLLLIGVLLVIAALIFFEYFSFVCSLGIVVVVAEPGCHGAGAIGRAWRLMKGKIRRAVLLMVVIFVLHAAIWPVVSNMESGGLLRGFLYTILTAAVQVFDFCTKTAFYYECKGAPRHQLPWCLPKTR